MPLDGFRQEGSDEKDYKRKPTGHKLSQEVGSGYDKAGKSDRIKPGPYLSERVFSWQELHLDQPRFAALDMIVKPLCEKRDRA